MRASSLSTLLVALLAACEEKKALPAPTPPAPASAPMPPPKVEKVEVPEVRVKANSATMVEVKWIIPSGTQVNDDAPFRVQWNRSDGLMEAPADVKSTGNAVKEGFHVKVQPMTGVPNPTLGGEISIIVCDAVNHSICLPVKKSVELGFIAVKDATDQPTVSIPLPSAH